MNEKKCRWPTCNVKKLQRFGLCNRHRKWVERGQINENLEVIGSLPLERGRYKNMICKIDGCTKRPRRNNMCHKHSSQLFRGIITESGERKSPVVRYPKDFQCIKCGQTGKIVKGFCRFHYSQLRKNIIDFDGNTLREPRRVMRYTDMDFCKAEGCSRRPRVRGWCSQHHLSFQKNHYDATGKRVIEFPIINKGKMCKECGERPARVRQLCTLHYYRTYQATRGKEFLNKNKKCLLDFCTKQAVTRGLCHTHYRRRLVREKTESSKNLVTSG